VSSARSIAMPETEFWRVLDLPSTGAAAVLRERLSVLPDAPRAAFHARLMLEYYALDTAAIWKESERQRVLNYDYERDLGTAAAFTSFRAAIILGGEDAVKAALATEAFPQMTAQVEQWDLPGATRSLSVATGVADVTAAIPLTVGMGKNPDGW
jgi:hypothetical protein